VRARHEKVRCGWAGRAKNGRARSRQDPAAYLYRVSGGWPRKVGTARDAGSLGCRPLRPATVTGQGSHPGRRRRPGLVGARKLSTADWMRRAGFLVRGRRRMSGRDWQGCAPPQGRFARALWVVVSTPPETMIRFMIHNHPFGISEFLGPATVPGEQRVETRRFRAGPMSRALGPEVCDQFLKNDCTGDVGRSVGRSARQQVSISSPSPVTGGLFSGATRRKYWKKRVRRVPHGRTRRRKNSRRTAAPGKYQQRTTAPGRTSASEAAISLGLVVLPVVRPAAPRAGKRRGKSEERSAKQLL